MLTLEDINKMIDNLEDAADQIATANFVFGVIVGLIAGLIIAAVL